jgi:hypothetical protein
MMERRRVNPENKEESAMSFREDLQAKVQLDRLVRELPATLSWDCDNS